MADQTVTPLSGRAVLAGCCRRIIDSSWFSVLVFAIILANATVLGIETYSGIAERWHGPLKLVEHFFLAAFTTEIALRASAHADRPKDFFRDPWNVFDLVVVVLAFLPVARENATVLRLLRLARVLRAARFLPQLRIVIIAVGKSLPGTASFLLVGALLLYVYSMVGWVFFADDDPERYGSIGRSALTLFLLMTLDGLGDAVHNGLEISRWSIVYYASYVLLGSFVLVNLLIGVVLNSLDEARTAEDEAALRRTRADGGAAESEELLGRIAAARTALDELEESLARLPGRVVPVPSAEEMPLPSRAPSR
jgi:voltage-gated sodium channel